MREKNSCMQRYLVAYLLLDLKVIIKGGEKFSGDGIAMLKPRIFALIGDRPSLGITCLLQP